VLVKKTKVNLRLVGALVAIVLISINSNFLSSHLPIAFLHSGLVFGKGKTSEEKSPDGGQQPPSSANNPPVATDQDVSTSTNTPIDITLSASDADNDPLLGIILTNTSHGSLSQVNQQTGMVTYTPENDYTGADSFTFKVNDGNVDSNPATVSITVGGAATGEVAPSTETGKEPTASPPAPTQEELTPNEVPEQAPTSTQEELNPNEVAQQAPASSQVGSGGIADQSVTTDKLADSAVTQDKLAVGAVDTPAIAPQSVTADKIQGVSKLIFATCALPEEFTTQVSCDVPGAAPGDSVIVTANECSAALCHGFENAYYRPSAAVVDNDKVFVHLESMPCFVPSLVPGERGPSADCAHPHAGVSWSGATFALLVFHQ